VFNWRLITSFTKDYEKSISSAFRTLFFCQIVSIMKNKQEKNIISGKPTLFIIDVLANSVVIFNIQKQNTTCSFHLTSVPSSCRFSKFLLQDTWSVPACYWWRPGLSSSSSLLWTWGFCTYMSCVNRRNLTSIDVNLRHLTSIYVIWRHLTQFWQH
jgi:uncharacterized membrane protein